MRLIFLLITGLLTCRAAAQSLSFDEFVKYSGGILDSAKLSRIEEILPEKFVITGADFGDISGDTLHDFAIAVRPSIRRSKDIYTYIFVDSSNTYIPVFADTVQFIELPIEVAFTISEKICLITQKLKENSWLFRGYSYLNNELSLVDVYRTGDQMPDRRNRIGNEFYENYKTLDAFNGYYNWTTLKEYKKNKYFNFPVYDLRRNIYKNYTEKLFITSSWMWDDSLKDHVNYGEISFSRHKDSLSVTLFLNRQNFLADSLADNIINLYFDRAPERILDLNKKKEPMFRNEPDENIGIIEMVLNHADLSKPVMVTDFGKKYRTALASAIRTEINSEPDGAAITITIPLKIFNSDTTAIGIFVTLEQIKGNVPVLTLRSSDGDPEDPSSYGRLYFIRNGDYYGNITNSRFNRLARKMKRNSL